MKTHILVLVLLATQLVAKANAALFGNTPNGSGAITIATSGAHSWGGAVAFTPLKDFTFTSVTIWLTGFSGLDIYGQQSQSFYAGIYDDAQNFSPDFPSGPSGKVASLSTPAPNDGSLASFSLINLSADTVLQANSQYWLFIYGKVGGGPAATTINWVGGGNPSGDATFNGAFNYSSPGNFYATTATPAFTINNSALTINAVPEPGSIAITLLSLAAWGGLALRKRRNA